MPQPLGYLPCGKPAFYCGQMDIYEIRRKRLRQLIDEQFNGVAAHFARTVGSEPSYINRVLSDNPTHRKNLGEDLARKYESATGKSRLWLDTLNALHGPPADYVVLPHGAATTPDDFALVVNQGWRGSCGGGHINWEERLKHPLAFQKKWLESKGLTVDNALILYADGESMRDFIQDGDVVLFNRSKTELKSGEIFALQHPEGIRIKRVRLDYDGSIIISSDNPDKRRFPDDRVPTPLAESIRLLGQFVWRGGG